MSKSLIARAARTSHRSHIARAARTSYHHRNSPVMIEKDYLKRQIDRFFEELTALLNPKAAKEEEGKQLELLTEKYTQHHLTYFLNTPTETLLSEYENDPEALEIISELLLQSTNEPATLQKTAHIIKYVDAVSKDFSFRRKNNLEKITALQN